MALGEFSVKEQSNMCFECVLNVFDLVVLLHVAIGSGFARSYF